MDNTYKTLLTERAGEVFIITLNRPEQRNALNLEMVREITQSFKDIRWDESIKVVILTGNGEKSFCAGVDLKERGLMDEAEILLSREKDIIPMYHYIGDFPKPLIGAINGVALGGGAELALVCDVRLGALGALFGQTEIKWGMIPSAGACQRLRAVAGLATAKELIFTGRIIEAEEAHKHGIYNRIVSQEELLKEARNLADEIAQNSFHALKQAKKVLDFGSGISPLLAFDLEASKECFYRGQAMTGHKAFQGTKG